MSDRDYYDEETLQSYRESLINRRNSLSPTTSQTYIKILDQMIAELPEHYGEEKYNRQKLLEAYLQKESGKRELERFIYPILTPFLVFALIIVLGAININLVGALFLAIPIVPLGFIILFFLLQWIIGKEKMNRHPLFITITLLLILVVVCIILSAVVF